MVNQFRKFVFGFLLLLLLPHQAGYCQESGEAGSTESELKNAAREIMSSASVCTLITLDEKGVPRARIMDPFIPEGDFTVWLGTNPKSRKVRQIKNDPRVTLCYLDMKTMGYVTLRGTAQLVDDQKEKDIRFKEVWESFYTDKKDGYLLIRISPEWMEVVSEVKGIVGDPETWQPQKVTFQ